MTDDASNKQQLIEKSSNIDSSPESSNLVANNINFTNNNSLHTSKHINAIDNDLSVSPSGISISVSSSGLQSPTNHQPRNKSIVTTNSVTKIEMITKASPTKTAVIQSNIMLDVKNDYRQLSKDEIQTEDEAEDSKNTDTNDSSHSSTVYPSDAEFPQNSETNELRNGEGWPIFEPLSGFYPLSVYKKDYIQLKNEILSGVVVSFAQVPEAVAFSFIAGVDPFIGLHAAWIVGFITSVFGGRCAEISGATGATAAVLAPYMADKDIGVQYLPYIMILVGIFIIIWGILGASKLVSFVPHSAMIGFVNGLAVVIGKSQFEAFHELTEKHPDKEDAFYYELFWMIGVALMTLIIVEVLPRFTKFVPSTLVAIAIGTFIEHVIIRFALGQETVLLGDLGDLSGGLPKIIGIDDYWQLPPLNWDTLAKITLPALTVALVSTVEDLLTIEVVHDLTNTRPRNQQKYELVSKLQIIAMGFANLVCGFFGAIGGGSAIGLTTINCYSANGRYRWSGVTCSICTFIIVLVASSALAAVPASSLVGVMCVVVFHTFEWSSIPIVLVTFLPATARQWINNKTEGRFGLTADRKIHRTDAFVILLVTILTIFTNLAYAIIAGVLVSCVMYTWDSAQQLTSKSDIYFDTKTNSDVKVYTLEGGLMFTNATKLNSIFDWNSDPKQIEIHFQNCTVYDFTALNQINSIAEHYRKLGKEVHLKNINIKSFKSLHKAKELLTNFSYDTKVYVQEMEEDVHPVHMNITQTDHLRGV